MSRFIDHVDESTRADAAEFVKMIEDGTIKKRILTNQSDDYSLESAYKNFQKVAGASEIKKLMKDF
ncbi:MAG: hypothetical protein A2Y33_15810 [Spirochaetes bacterium GWF1_51_8]|nr:MAG: hypothetical protein A2Y33_15810 [Spirochaetes bacterium GWF1_51_8]